MTAATERQYRSHCGFTPKFKVLQTLYDRYKSDDPVVLGFPRGQFKDQEFDIINQTMNFCQVNDNATFPLFAKIDVAKDYLPVMKERCTNGLWHSMQTTKHRSIRKPPSLRRKWTGKRNFWIISWR